MGTGSEEVLSTLRFALSRLVIISLLPNKNVPDEELQAELRKRLESKAFSVERIAIITDTEIVEEAKID